MQELTRLELLKINGGISKTFIVGLGLGIVFVVSVIYGFIYPNKC